MRLRRRGGEGLSTPPLTPPAPPGLAAGCGAGVPPSQPSSPRGALCRRSDSRPEAGQRKANRRALAPANDLHDALRPVLTLPPVYRRNARRQPPYHRPPIGPLRDRRVPSKGAVELGGRLIGTGLISRIKNDLDDVRRPCERREHSPRAEQRS